MVRWSELERLSTTWNRKSCAMLEFCISQTNLEQKQVLEFCITVLYRYCDGIIFKKKHFRITGILEQMDQVILK
jgi:hypothetical protein